MDRQSVFCSSIFGVQATVLSQDTFNTISIFNNVVHVCINEDLRNEKAKLFLLGASDEELQQVYLPEGQSTISLLTTRPQAHAIRLETGHEVVFKNIPPTQP